MIAILIWGGGGGGRWRQDPMKRGRVFGGFPGFYRGEGHAFLAQRRPEALVADVVHPPLRDQEVRRLGQLHVENGRSWPPGLVLAIFLISRRCPRVNLGARPPLYFGYREPNPSALKFRITSRTRSSLVNATFAIAAASMP